MRWILIMAALAVVGCDEGAGATSEARDCTNDYDVTCSDAMKSCCQDMDEWNADNETCSFAVSADDCDLDLQHELCECAKADGITWAFCDHCD
ncbi:MAG: hypothetical protein JRF63_07120 [Deltaproteobacteria bacterium]|nr:hypothetical protein [Deltaproteobacteria bacterium]